MSSKLTKLMVGAALAGQLATTLAVAPLFAQDGKPTAASKPHIDLAFCIDTTGSMSGEIENVKAKTKELVAKLAGGKPAPVIRVGLVAYRDHGDSYVTKVFPFSEDIDKVVKDISSLAAQGGGDAPEAVNEALHASLNDLQWSSNAKTLKLLFLIGDAGPKHYAKDFDWRTEAKSAISRGIQINTLGCSGLEHFTDSEGVGVFKEIAKLSDGKYESLAYRQEIVNAEGKRETVIATGGSMYRVKAKSAEAWKDGAAALAARGEADKLTDISTGAGASMSEGFYAAADAPAFVGITSGTTRVAGRIDGRPVVRDYRAAAAGAMARRAVYAEAPSAMSISRTDNNLADIVLKTTKEAAAKKLNVDFHE